MSTEAEARKPGTLIPASKKLDAPGKRLLRIVTVCSSADEFVQLFSELVDETSIYIVTRHPLPAGTRRLVRVQLANGETVMRADGEISESHANGEGPGGQNGMRLKLLTMDERTHAIHKKLLVHGALARQQPPRPPPPPPPPDADLRPQAVPVKTTAPYPFTAALPGIAPIKTPAVTPTPMPLDPNRPIVPANPFAELAPSALEHYVECVLYEETAPHDLREIEAQTQEALRKEKEEAAKEKEKEKEKEPEKAKEAAAVAPLDEAPARKRIPAAVWTGILAALVGAGAGWLVRGSQMKASPPAPTPAPVVAAQPPTPEPAVVKETPKPEVPKPAPAPAPEPAPALIPELPALNCTASITSMPAGADVTWGGKSLGKTPLTGVSVPCGEADVKVENERDDPRELHLAATADHPLEIVAPFGKYASQLELRSKPPGAVFTVNGIPAGAAPTDATVPIGARVTVMATLEGHKRWTLKVLAKKKKQYVQARLSPE